MARRIKKEVVYTMPYETVEDMKAAERKRERLYDKYNNVSVYPNGLHEVRIVASN